jgi:hypothetical protein
MRRETYGDADREGLGERERDLYTQKRKTRRFPSVVKTRSTYRRGSLPLRDRCRERRGDRERERVLRLKDERKGEKHRKEIDPNDNAYICDVERKTNKSSLLKTWRYLTSDLQLRPRSV